MKVKLKKKLIIEIASSTLFILFYLLNKLQVHIYLQIYRQAQDIFRSAIKHLSRVQREWGGLGQILPQVTVEFLHVASVHMTSCFSVR